jgi:hypothetical protein
MEIDARVIITALAVLGFALSAFGAFRLLAQSRGGVRRMNEDRQLRDGLLVASRRDRERIAQLPEEEREAAQKEATARWVGGHTEAGIEPYGWQSVNSGREPLAERIIEELGESSKVDVALILAGLVLSLASGMVDTWWN